MAQYRMRWPAAVLLILVIGFLVGCQRGKGPPPAFPPPLVTVATPQMLPVQHYLEYNGFLDAVETVQIRARVKGFLVDAMQEKGDTVPFKEGDEVPEGKILYQIDPREYLAALAKSQSDIEKGKADVANAKAQIQLAVAERDRVKRGYNNGVTAKSDLDKAEAQLAANEAQLLTANASVDAAQASKDQAQLNLDFTTIRAPIAGRISRTQVTKGNLVGQNESTLLTTIVRMDPLYVFFDIPERDLVNNQRELRERKQQDGTEVQVGVATEEGFPHVGKINFLENRVETGTGTIRVRGEIPNPLLKNHSTERLLYPGLYARVRIPVGKEAKQPVIPEEALMTGQEGRYVYVVGADNKVEKRSVTVGPQVWFINPAIAAAKSGWLLVPGERKQQPMPDKPPPPEPIQSLVAIETGLKADERIIVNGLQKARPGEAVLPDEWQLREPLATVPANKK